MTDNVEDVVVELDRLLRYSGKTNRECAEIWVSRVAAAVLKDVEGFFLLSDMPDGILDGVKRRWGV
jgi:hypothetical protein